MANPQNLRPPWKPGESGNPKGKPKGRRSLATIVRELENEDFEWDKLPIMTDEMKEAVDTLKKFGSPWRAVVTRALMDSLNGDKKAMEWLRKSGYGDKLDVTSKGKEIVQPLVIPDIPARNVANKEEAAEST